VGALGRHLAAHRDVDHQLVHIGTAAHQVARADWTVVLRVEGQELRPAISVATNGAIDSLVVPNDLEPLSLQPANDKLIEKIKRGAVTELASRDVLLLPPGWRATDNARVAIVPIHDAASMRGAIVLRTRRRLSTAEREALVVVAGVAAVALGCAQRVAGAEQELADRSIVSAELGRLPSSADAAKVASMAVAAIQRVTGAAWVRMLRVEAGVGCVIGTTDTSEAESEWHHLDQAPIVQRALTCGAHSTAIYDDVIAASWAHPQGRGKERCVAIDLGALEGANAVMLIGTTAADAEAVTETCGALATPMWLAISRAMVRDELRLRVKILRLLRKHCGHGGEGPDVAALLAELSELTRAAAGVHLGHAHMFDRATARTLRLSPARGPATAVIRGWRHSAAATTTLHDGHVTIPMVVDGELVGMVRGQVVSAAAESPYAQTLLAEIAAELGAALLRAAFRSQMDAAARQLHRAEERQRIAGEMHEAVAGLLMRIASEAATIQPHSASHGLTALARSAQSTLDEALGALAASPLRASSFPARLRQLAQSAPIASHGHVTVRVVGKPRRLDAAVEAALFDFARVAVMTLQRHSRATSVAARLNYSDHSVRLLVRDNGLSLATRPIDGAEMHGTLRRLQNALEEAGGRLQFASPQSGVTLEAVIPVAADGSALPAAASGTGDIPARPRVITHSIR
jgi:signal transduction histidine kinase